MRLFRTIFIFLLLGPSLVHASYVLKEVKLESGKRTGSILSLTQDSTGFVWIGTRMGLLSFDGRTVTIFDHDVSNPKSLSDNYVRTIYEDRNKNLWIGTNAAGLELYNNLENNFTHFRHQSADPSSLSHDSVNVLLHDSRDVLWVGTQIGLNQMDPLTHEITRVPIEPDDPTRLGHPYIYDLHEDQKGNIWIATVGGGLYRFNPLTNHYTNYIHESQQEIAAGRNYIFDIEEDRDGTLWLATQAGLSVVDPDQQILKTVPLPSVESEETLLCTMMHFDQEQTLWIGTWGHGVLAYNPQTNTLEPLESSEEIENARISGLEVDSSGNVWIGTWDHGLHRAVRLPESFHRSEIREPIDSIDAMSMHLRSDGTFFVGTWGNGLAIYNPATKILSTENTPAPNNPFFNQGTVRAVVEDPQGNVWIGTNSGLFRWNAKTDDITSWDDPDSPNGVIGEGFITELLWDRSKSLWIGVGGSGLYRWTGDDAELAHFVNIANDPRSISDDYITRIFQDSSNNIWIGTRSGGLNLFDPQSETFTRYLPDATTSNSLGHQYVTDIAEGLNATLWIGTGSGGLTKISTTSEPLQFKIYTERDGLPSDNIRGVAVEDNGTLWLSTNVGITRFDPDQEVIINYNMSDISGTSDFNVGAVSSDTRAVYFGNASGITSVDKFTDLVLPPASPTVIRSFLTLEDSVFVEHPARNRELISIPFGELLAFDFSVLEYSAADTHRFAYSLDDEKSWVELGNRHSITIADLRPGLHSLTVKGRNSHGIWSQTLQPLSIEIHPPFWMTWWFRLLAIAAIVLLVYVIHRVRTHELSERNKSLVRLKTERETALKEASKRRDELHQAYDQLRKLTRRLEMAKENERKRIAQELHDEMGQALTAAKINLQILLRDPKKPGATQRIEDAIDLVDNMISHVRSLSLDLRPPLLDQLGLGAAVRGYLESQQTRIKIPIKPSLTEIPEHLAAEVEIAIFRVIQEAMTNIIRHAQATSCSVKLVATEDKLSASIEDDGVGFDVDEAFEEGIIGRHLGLLGIRERIESLGGTVHIHSTKGKGSEVQVSVPLQMEA